MDSSRFGPGRSSEEERPVITGQSDKEAWIAGLTDYVNSMKEICPDARHPPMEWLSAGFSMISLDQGQSAAATPAQSSLATVRRVVRDKVSQPMANMQRKLDVHTQRHTVNEFKSQ